jgi:hypothetical protein
VNPIDHRATNSIVTSDIEKLFQQSKEDVFDVRIFKANLEDLETVAENADVVGSMEAGERLISFVDPVESKAMILANDNLILATDDGSDPADGSVQQPIVMLIQEPDIPKHSVVQYEEYVNATEVRQVTLCVLHSETFGRSPVIGTKHYLVPFANNEGTFEG